VNRFSDNIERMKSRHVLGTVFCLAASVLYTPMAFAAGTDLARLELQRMPGTLLQQISGMDVGSIELGAGNDFTVTRSDGSQYVFENVAQDASGVASATVSAYDSNGTLTDTAAVNRLTAVDANRVDFEAQITPAGGSAATVIGSLTGLRTTMYTAVGSINADGESRAMVIDYSGVNESGDMTASSVVLTPMDGVGQRGGAVLVLVMIIVIVVFMAYSCFAWGWWGC